MIASRFKRWIVNQSRNEPDIMKAYLPATLKLITDDDNFNPSKWQFFFQ